MGAAPIHGVNHEHMGVVQTCRSGTGCIGTLIDRFGRNLESLVSIVRFEVIDTRTGDLVGFAKTRNRANRIAVRRDSRLGAHVTRIKVIWSDGK